MEQEQARRFEDLLRNMGASFKNICVEEVSKLLTGENVGKYLIKHAILVAYTLLTLI